MGDRDKIIELCEILIHELNPARATNIRVNGLMERIDVVVFSADEISQMRLELQDIRRLYAGLIGKEL